MEERKQFSLQEVADMLGVSKKTVQRWIKDEKLEAVSLGKKKFIKKEELERFQMENEQEGIQEVPEQLVVEKVDSKTELFKKLWSLATKLRGQIDGWDFKQYILGFMFYRYISENFTKYINNIETEVLDSNFKYENQKDEDIESGRENLVNDKGFFIKPSQLFSNVYKNAKNDENLNITLAEIFKDIESSTIGNPSEETFKGLFEDMDLTSTKLGKDYTDKKKTLLGILKVVNSIELIDGYGHIQNDMFGDAYEYLMGMYASEAGKSGGEYFTPQEVSEILANIVTNGKTKIDKIYDPTCGSGSLLLKAAKVIGKDNIGSYYGQELNPTTYNLCRINMHLHDINYSRIDIKNDNTLTRPKHLDLAGKFDAVVANPPYSIKAVDTDSKEREYDLDINDPRFSPAGVVAPDRTLDYAFVMHILYSMSENSTGAIVLPLGAFHRSIKEEDIIRGYLVDNNYVDAVITLPQDVFFGTGIQTGILVLKKNKTDNSILFIDGTKEFERITTTGARRVTKNILTEENIKTISDLYSNRAEVEGKTTLKTNDEVKEAGYNLASSNYFKNTEELTSDDFINTIFDYYQYKINASRNEFEEKSEDTKDGE